MDDAHPDRTPLALLTRRSNSRLRAAREAMIRRLGRTPRPASAWQIQLIADLVEAQERQAWAREIAHWMRERPLNIGDFRCLQRAALLQHRLIHGGKWAWREAPAICQLRVRRRTIIGPLR